MSSGGHKTSAIPRPPLDRRDPTRGSTRTLERESRNATDSILSDLTSPIAREKQLVKGRGKRTLITVAAAVITAALIVALFVLPVKAYLRQRADIDRKQRELTALDQANAELTAQVNQLNTPEGVEEAAREEIGYVRRGEIRLTVLPSPAAPLTIPSGWPYDAISSILAVRQQGVAQPATTAALAPAAAPTAAPTGIGNPTTP
jgi:cell division protein FtsB